MQLHNYSYSALLNKGNKLLLVTPPPNTPSELWGRDTSVCCVSTTPDSGRQDMLHAFGQKHTCVQVHGSTGPADRCGVMQWRSQCCYITPHLPDMKQAGWLWRATKKSSGGIASYLCICWWSCPGWLWLTRSCRNFGAKENKRCQPAFMFFKSNSSFTRIYCCWSDKIYVVFQHLLL